MSRRDVKERIAGAASQAHDLARRLATPLQQAHLSPLAGMILAFLGLTTLGSALFAAYAILGPIDSDAGVNAPDWTPPTLAVVDLDPPKPPSADVETLSRPIFTKTRRPSPKTTKPAAEADMGPVSAAPSGITVGAIVKDKKKGQAFIVSLDTPDGAWKKVGDTVDSWTLATIEGVEIVLKSGQRTAKLKLYPEEQAEPGPNGPFPPPPPPPPPLPAPASR